MRGITGFYRGLGLSVEGLEISGARGEVCFLGLASGFT